MRRPLLAAALGVGLTAGAYLVLAPDGAVPDLAVTSLTGTLAGAGAPGWVADDDVVQFVLNVALFVPPVLLAALLAERVPWWGWLLIGLLVSGVVETIQALFLADRTPEVADLVANTLGAGLGAALARVVRRAPAR